MSADFNAVASVALMNPDINPRAVIGGNQPPEPTPYEIAERAVNDIYEEAKLWLDGAKVADQKTADGIGNLVALIRKEKEKAEAAKETDYRPHKDAADAVTAKYKPLLAKMDKAATACKGALQPWLDELDRKLKAEQKRLRDEAEAKAREAQEALRAAQVENLAEREAAEELVAAAKWAEKKANKIERETATAGGAFGRAVGMRTVYTAVMTDPRAAVLHYWQNQRKEMLAYIQALADQDVRLGKRAPDAIPGFRIDESKVPV